MLAFLHCLILEKKKAQLEKHGWTFAKYEEQKGLKGIIEPSIAEFHRLQPPSFSETLFDWIDENGLKIWATGFSVAVVFLLFQCHQLSQKMTEENHKRSTASQQESETKRKNRVQTAAQVAESLKNFLRNQGVNEALIIDVKADEFGFVFLVVSNSWLERPKYEQKQMKQVIELALQKIASPDGWPFYLTDYLGNRI